MRLSSQTLTAGGTTVPTAVGLASEATLHETTPIRVKSWLEQRPAFGRAEWPYDWAGGLDGILLNDVDTPDNAPSRGPALDHGSARFQAYRHPLIRTLSAVPARS
jgi:hypothetical protein